jgi:polyferredoxin
MIIFVGLVLTAIFANSVFCGWMCPLGAIQQFITGIRRWIVQRVPALQSLSRALSVQAEKVAFLDRWLRYVKYLIVLWILWGTITYGVMVFRDVDPWAALITITEPERNFGFIVLIGLLIAAVFGDRIWCRYLCPLGAIVGLIGKISPIKVQRDGDKCIACGKCRKACPMDLKVDQMTRVSATECTMCMNCVESCPVHGALDLKVVMPGVKAESPEPVGKAN